MHNISYLWLRLVFQIIEDSPTDYSRPSDLESLLRDLPTEVSAAYEKILNKACNSSNRRKMELLFEILLAADKPLCIEAVDHAVTIALRETEFESMRAFLEETWGDSFEQTLGNLTGFLVIASIKNVAISPHIVVWEPFATVAFSHQTAREFPYTKSQLGVGRDVFSIPKRIGHFYRFVSVRLGYQMFLKISTTGHGTVHPCSSTRH